MKIYHFEAGSGERIDKFGSNFIFSKIARLDAELKISCFHMGQDGIVGYHQAVTPQLFLVVQGSGWVRGEAPARIPIEAHQAVFWDKGEWHEAGTTTGLTAIVLEGEIPNPGEFMPARNDS